MCLCVCMCVYPHLGSPGGSDSKESACNVRDLGFIPGLGRSPGGDHGNPLQYSCLRTPMDRRTRWATVHGITKSLIQLSDQAQYITQIPTPAFSKPPPIGDHQSLCP